MIDIEARSVIVCWWAVETLDCRQDGSGSSPDAGAYFFVFPPESTPFFPQDNVPLYHIYYYSGY